ncbi:hypothetical protein F2Q68_00018100 [Brassica cretica]|nr:hypothetical protein F2Q68_00018100 [Brassica cretica]KAF3586236.1 hypothetical protein F2Q69_00032192 [Brassica cretica]
MNGTGSEMSLIFGDVTEQNGSFGGRHGRDFVREDRDSDAEVEEWKRIVGEDS